MELSAELQRVISEELVWEGRSAVVQQIRAANLRGEAAAWMIRAGVFSELRCLRGEFGPEQIVDAVLEVEE